MGAIGFNSKAPLKLIIGNLNAVQYQVQILHDVQTLGKVCVGAKQPWVFMQDLAPAHNAGSTRQYLQNKKVKILDWPGNSRDLNPIENVWSWVVAHLPLTLPKNAVEFMARVQAVWESIPQSYIQTLF